MIDTWNKKLKQMDMFKTDSNMGKKCAQSNSKKRKIQT